MPKWDYSELNSLSYGVRTAVLEGLQIKAADRVGILFDIYQYKHDDSEASCMRYYASDDKDYYRSVSGKLIPIFQNHDNPENTNYPSIRIRKMVYQKSLPAQDQIEPTMEGTPVCQPAVRQT